VLIWQRKQIARFFRDWRRNRFAYLLVLPAMFFISFTVVFPFCYNVVLSFSNMSLKHFQDWQITGLQSYREVFADFEFYRVLLKTIVWTVVNVFFHVTIGLLLAVALNGPLRGKQIYRVLLIIPWAVPAYITALTWRGMFDYKYGAINLMIEQYLHMPIVNWLGSPWEAFSACILTNVWLGFPFMMVIALGGMQGIPQELYEAARVDRVPRRQQFFHITLPMLKPVLLPAITLGTIWTFNNLNVIWLVSNGGEPSDKTHILVSYVYKAVFNLYRYGYGAALSMVIFFILLAFSLVFLQKTEATKGV
jgi:arabinogalactan oligomer/maltooligosaccharide transport system permease protein